ncbi:hypothetical protein KY343_04360 [Candidatus Woesearchaeota archaeon]|nr:hypothetical protein [Candidatus Woesearchaeota archaeon]
MIYGFYEKSNLDKIKTKKPVCEPDKKQASNKSKKKPEYTTHKKTTRLFKLSLVLMMVDVIFTYFILHYYGFQELNNVIRNLYSMTPNGLLIFLWCPLVYMVLKIISKFFSALKITKYYKVVLLYYIVANVVAITNNAVQFGKVVI